MQLEPGVVVDRYRIEELLGEGGMGTVYRVTHVVLGSTHALKVMHTERLGDEGLRERFLAEGRILAQISHPNVVRVTDVVALPDLAGLVQDLIDGPPLHDHLAGLGRPLSPAEAEVLLAPVLDGVHYVHGNGIVHRDLKPGNIMLAQGTGGRIRPVVVDFGVAKLVAGAAVDHDRKQATQAGSVMGTLYYMSPEQVVGSTAVDHRTDIFALGAILYEMLTGQIAFAGQTDYLVQKRIVDCDFDVGLLARIVPAPVAAVVRCALSKEPADRYPSGEAFGAALRQAVRAPGAPGPTPPAPGPAPPPQGPTPPPQGPTPPVRPGQTLIEPAPPPAIPPAAPAPADSGSGKSGLLVGVGVGLAVVLGGGLLLALLVVGGVLMSDDKAPARSEGRGEVEAEAEAEAGTVAETETVAEDRGRAEPAGDHDAVASCDATRRHSTCIDYDAGGTAGLEGGALRSLCDLLNGNWGTGACPRGDRTGTCDGGAGSITHTYSTGGDPRYSGRARALCSATGGRFDSSP